METIAPAREADLSEITELLARCALPTADVAPHLAHFSVARDDGRIVGAIGVEVHGRLGLLRSLATAPDHRGEGIALRLYATQLGVARRLGIERLYCLTTSARGFFEMLGWRALLRDEVPQEIQATAEFASLWPLAATCMVRPMPRD